MMVITIIIIIVYNADTLLLLGVLYSFLLVSFLFFQWKFILASPPWKPMWSTWNCNTVNTITQLKACLFHSWYTGEQKEHSPPSGAVVTFSWFWRRIQNCRLTYNVLHGLNLHFNIFLKIWPMVIKIRALWNLSLTFHLWETSSHLTANYCYLLYQL